MFLPFKAPLRTEVKVLKDLKMVQRSKSPLLHLNCCVSGQAMTNTNYRLIDLAPNSTWMGDT